MLGRRFHAAETNDPALRSRYVACTRMVGSTFHCRTFVHFHENILDRRKLMCGQSDCRDRRQLCTPCDGIWWLITRKATAIVVDPWRLPSGSAQVPQRPRHNAEWQITARIEDSNVLRLDRRDTLRVSPSAFEWSACERGNHVAGWWLSLVHGLGKPMQKI